ncbi:MAG: hypothetical protein DRR16_33335 [Candidatus Parabeggiatoa sp. nov. 3]|nr:MAG: hypothetical protein DRR00_14295 [Gammaproteobacteria bacterium]RKZ60959.1 MAG: hypothetical protein DRQ99_21235 [Gammaproteobacteria bacterium]RKZ73166.1 MAG: hypothetical protein DRR16_33335 [Gammaproteobacteria bacterium]
MLQTYEAIYNGQQFRWLNDIPPKRDKEVHVVIVMDVEKTIVKSKPNIHDVLQRTRGAWGKGKTLDEIDAEIHTMRSEWEGKWD